VYKNIVIILHCQVVTTVAKQHHRDRRETGATISSKAQSPQLASDHLRRI
jgi:hypothetical protein